MSETTTPIDPTRFAEALEGLPIDSLHAKAAEIRNSQTHLRHSNEQMLPFAEEGDQDCKDAMFENLAVIGRMNQRVELIRAEVEKRGMRWSEGEVEDREGVNGEAMVDGEGRVVNGTVGATTNGVDGEATVDSAVSGEVPAPRAPSGRVTDEELRRQLETQMGEDDDEDGEGVHL